MKIANSLSELIGKTPLLELHKLQSLYNVEASIIAKLEYFNPAGSVKDRVAKSMIDAAEKLGLLKEGSVIIEPTSGNTGVGLASVAAAKGYRVILTMPDTMSIERRNLLKAYGAELVLTDGKLLMQGAIDKANELASEIPNAYIPSQFSNPSNAEIHYKTTGPEIYEDTDGKIDVFIAGIGTGGTITGTGRYLKDKNPSIKVIGVEPESSPYLTRGIAGPHMLQGIGAGFIPDIFDINLCDEIMTVRDEDAFKLCKAIAKSEGLLVGITSGATVSAAIELSKRPEYKNKNIIVLLPDSGERYLSNPMYLD